MKLTKTNLVEFSVRCRYRTATGRQCRSAISDAQSSLCPRHHSQQKQWEARPETPDSELRGADVVKILTTDHHGFQTAQGINHSLSRLYLLAAQNLISPRRAAVLAYIGSLLLRTLPAIDADRAAGITDPTKTKAVPIPDPDQTQKPS